MIAKKDAQGNPRFVECARPGDTLEGFAPKSGKLA